jgi:hypothetical protein
MRLNGKKTAVSISGPTGHVGDGAVAPWVSSALLNLVPLQIRLSSIPRPTPNALVGRINSQRMKEIAVLG